VILFVLVVLVALFVVLPLIGMALWAVLSTILVGLVLGAVARLALPGSQPIGFAGTVGSGLCGSIVGGFLGQHVLHVHWLGTVLLEVGAAAIIVALISRRSSRVGARRRS
jgi:uncharacterized membrane protein YeaQ/YmgE (transglycosylase-associated protein family)